MAEQPIPAVVEVRIPGGAEYDVTVGGDLARVRQEAASAFPGGRLVVSDANVAPHHLERVAGDCDATATLVLPCGEEHKTPETLVHVVRHAAQQGLDRSSVIIALGGGVVGDVAGLAAAVFMRGVAFINCATSLLAMVDAAIGGKTGVDLPEGKNLLGAFHQPRAVISDVSLLATLPEAEWRHGMAEVIKTAIIGDPDLLDVLEQHTLESLRADTTLTAEVVRRCAAVKAGVVMRDEHESGERMQLNAGHTIGHAIEAASRFVLPHGQAVAIGLLLETVVAERLQLDVPPGFVDRLRDLLVRYTLPTAVDPTLVDDALPRLAFDKKKHAGRLRYALPVAPGSVQIVTDVPAQLVEDVMRASHASG